MTKICSKPFGKIEIDVNGNCYCCCRWWNNSYCFGNIFTDSIEEIWNGKAAKELRETILDGSYKYCNTKECLISYDQNIKHETIANYPQEISLCYDYTCTAKCVFCNDNVKKMTNEEIEKWNSLIDKKLIPFFKNARFVRVNMTGELFVSEHSKKVVKQIAQTYPNIKFEIVTNGIFATKESLQELGITDKILTFKVSLPSMKKTTYNKLVRNGNLIKVLENLKYISSLKRENKIEKFSLNFIINSLNYKEIIEYVRNAEKLDATVDCLMLDKNNEDTEFLKHFDLYNVLDKNHPSYNHFLTLINSKEFNKFKNVNINSEIKKLKRVSFLKQLSNTIRCIFRRIKKYKKV